MHSTKFLSLLIILAFSLAACFPKPAQPTQGIPDDIRTSAVQTAVIDITLTALVKTPLSTATATKTPTQVTPTITASPTPVNTQVFPTYSPPEPTANCNWAQFIGDITIKDGTRMPPGERFTKVWRLRNIGECTWTRNYAAVFTSGDRMGAQPAVNMPFDVPPGALVDITIPMTAPQPVGDYIGNWMIRSERGEIFGVGPFSNANFNVQIKVRNVTPPVYPTPTEQIIGGPSVIAPTYFQPTEPIIGGPSVVAPTYFTQEPEPPPATEEPLIGGPGVVSPKLNGEE